MLLAVQFLVCPKMCTLVHMWHPTSTYDVLNVMMSKIRTICQRGKTKCGFRVNFFALTEQEIFSLDIDDVNKLDSAQRTYT